MAYKGFVEVSEEEAKLLHSVGLNIYILCTDPGCNENGEDCLYSFSPERYLEDDEEWEPPGYRAFSHFELYIKDNRHAD